VNLYEFEGKALLARLGVRTPRGVFCPDMTGVDEAGRTIGFPCVVKSQVLTGGRGKAGGITIVNSPDELSREADRIVRLKIGGETPVGLLVEERVPVDKEFYAAVAFDTSLACPVLLFSPRGGMEVEANTSSLLRIPVPVEDLPGIPPAWVAERLTPLLPQIETQALGAHLEGVTRLLANLLSAFGEYDLDLIEINPLVATDDGLIAADAKVTVDDDALFRQLETLGLVERPALPEFERRAREFGLNYVDLDGEICLMANGAGLNLSLLDAVAAFGSTPANFLDTGGGASRVKAYEGARILQDRSMRDPKVRARLIVLSLAITRAREATGGIAEAMDEFLNDPVPTFAVVHGTGADEGRDILERHGIKIAPDIRTAVEWAASAERGSGVGVHVDRAPVDPGGPLGEHRLIHDGSDHPAKGRA